MAVRQTTTELHWQVQVAKKSMQPYAVINWSLCKLAQEKEQIIKVYVVRGLSKEAAQAVCASLHNYTSR